MKKTLLFVSLFAFAVLFMSNRSGRTTVTGNPATGAPGESGQTCGSFGCHNSGAFSPAVTLKLMDSDGNDVTKYKPGETYQVGLNIAASGNPAGYGFQMVSLKDADESGVNTFTNLQGSIQEVMALERQYIEQSNIIQTNNITVDWTAPDNGTGSVTFYAIGNAVNGAMGSGGDGVAQTNLTISEDIQSSTEDLERNGFILFPNPVNDVLNISGREAVKTEIYDLNGRILLSSFESTINLSHLEQGVYISRIVDTQNKVETKKIVKN